MGFSRIQGPLGRKPGSGKKITKSNRQVSVHPTGKAGWWEHSKNWAADNLASWLAPALHQFGETKHEWFWKFLAHFLTGKGSDFTEFKMVPTEWQNAIKTNWRKKDSVRSDVMKKYPQRYPKGKYRIKPYNWGISDLTRSLGHFDMTVTTRDKIETYTLEDRYEFPYYDEMDGKLKKHGGTNVELPRWLVEKLRLFMPQKEYEVPSGVDKGTIQKFELIDKGGGKWDIFLPTRWLQDNGTPFPFSATFSSRFDIQKFVSSFDDGWVWSDLDEDDLANDLMFVNDQGAVIKVFTLLKKEHSTNARAIAEYYVSGLHARSTAPTLSSISSNSQLVTILKDILGQSQIANLL